MMIRKRILAMAAPLALLGAVSHAQVIGTGSPSTVVSGQGGSFGLSLNASGSSVDGINGKVAYDPGYLSNFQIQLGAAQAGFTLATNEVAPGDLRFVVYKNPPDASLLLAQPILDLSYDSASGLVGGNSTFVTFEMAAAARILPDPPNDVISMGIGGPGGVPAAVTVAFGEYLVPLMGKPDVDPQPINIVANVGQDVVFNVGANGLGQPFGFQWFNLSGSLSGETGASLQLLDVTASDAGSYRCDVTNAAGTSSSVAATLTVLDPAASNSAAFLDDTVPATVFAGSSIYVGITFQNTSQLSWTSPQGYSLAVTADANSIFGGAQRLSLVTPQTVVQPGLTHTFNALITAPGTAGNYTATVQMIEEGVAFFGPATQINLNVIDKPNSATDMKLFD